MKRILSFMTAFMVVLSCAIPAFASTLTLDGKEFTTQYKVDDELYDFQEHYNSNKAQNPMLQYVIHKYNGYYILFRANNGFYLVDESVNGSQYTLKVKSGGSYDRFLWENGVWKYQSSGSTTSGLSTGYKSSFMWSTDDLYQFVGVDKDDVLMLEGDPNFTPPPAPLAEVIRGVTEETLKTETLPAMGGTMKVLVLCGVGLIASLVVLKLFGKRSLISLR